MEIIKKEILRFNEMETKAFQIVSKICVDLMNDATDPILKELAKETFKNITNLWECEE